MLLTLVVSLLVAGGVVGGLQGAGGGASVVREPSGTPGADPFMPAPGADGSALPQVRNVSATVAGDAPGLYGGTRTESCDGDRIAAFLAAHPEQAQAWADVQGIAPDGIDAFLATLTPVVLRSDTAVTNHGFRVGRANELQSVLEAGTGVLIDPFGVPRVRCYCGNPLGPPAAGTAQAGGATTVQPSRGPVAEFVVVDPGTNTVVARPTGTRGERDRPADATRTRQALATTGSVTQGGSAAPTAPAVGGGAGAGTGGGSGGTPDPVADPGRISSGPKPDGTAPVDEPPVVAPRTRTAAPPDRTEVDTPGEPATNPGTKDETGPTPTRTTKQPTTGDGSDGSTKDDGTAIRNTPRLDPADGSGI